MDDAEKQRKEDFKGDDNKFVRWWVKPSETKRGMFVETDPACFPAGTMISTSGGAKPIERIEVGDRVVSANGKLTTVRALLPSVYEGEMVRLKAAGLGDELVSTADHPIAVVRGMECRDHGRFDGARRWCTNSCTVKSCSTPFFQDYTPSWVKATEVKVGDFLLMPYRREADRVQLVTPTMDRVIGLGDDVGGVTLAWFLGLFVAEGHTKSGGDIALSFHQKETDLHEQAEKCLAALGCKTTKTTFREGTLGAVTVGYSVELARWLRQVCGHLAENKRFPAGVFAESKQVLRDCVDGYMRGDGSVILPPDEQRASAASVSKELAYQLRAAVMMLGGKPRLQVLPSKVGNDGVLRLETYCVTWVPRGDSEFDWEPKIGGGRLHRQEIAEGRLAAHEPIDGDYLWLPVTSVERFGGSMEVFNFSCDETNQTYVANGVAVHNCFWEHSYKLKSGDYGHCICLKKNKLGDHCPVCEADNWASFVGALTIIDFEEWEDKKGNKRAFQRREFIAKMGSEDKPGVLKRLAKLAKKHGRLAGLIVDIERPGKLTERCGSVFDVVDKIDEKDIAEYAKEQALADLEKHPWTPLNHVELNQPLSLAEMEALALKIVPKDRDDDKDDKKSDSKKGGDAKTTGGWKPKGAAPAPASRGRDIDDDHGDGGDDDLPF